MNCVVKLESFALDSTAADVSASKVWRLGAANDPCNQFRSNAADMTTNDQRHHTNEPSAWSESSVEGEL